MLDRMILICLALGAGSPPAGRPDPATERQCARIDRQIERIHAEMRAGYDAKKGIRLAERLRELRGNRARLCR